MAKGSGSAGRASGASAASQGTGPAALTTANVSEIARQLGATPFRPVAVADVREAFYNRFDPAGRTTTEQFDRALLNMSLNRDISLQRSDDPQLNRGRIDRFAVNINGAYRHFLYLR